MEKRTQVTLFVAECPRLKIGIRLFEQTWDVHIKPFHPLEDQHLDLIQSIINNCDEQQPVWFKTREPNRMCIIKQVSNFLPGNRFLLVSFNKYSEKFGCVTSAYPVDDLPAKSEGYILL